jgi:hypothetical protein
MSKKNKKKPLNLNDIITKLKTQLDPKVRANRVKFRNETSFRLGNLYTLLIGFVIIIITSYTVIMPFDKFYPFNYSNAGQVRNSIGLADAKAKDILSKLDEATKYESVVTDQEKRLNDLLLYVADKKDPLSFMIFLQDTAKKADVKVDSLVLPEDRKTAIVTNNIDVTKQGQNTTVNNQPSNGSGTMLPVQPVATPQATALPNGQAQSTGDNANVNSAPQDESSYIIDVKLVGMYTKLTAFFNNLENTKEIIEISDVRFKQYKPEKLDDNGNVIPSTDKSKIDINNFDMQQFQTQVEFKIKLYDKDSILKTKLTNTANNSQTTKSNSTQPVVQTGQSSVGNPSPKPTNVPSTKTTGGK